MTKAIQHRPAAYKTKLIYAIKLKDRGSPELALEIKKNNNLLFWVSIFKITLVPAS